MGSDLTTGGSDHSFSYNAVSSDHTEITENAGIKDEGSGGGEKKVSKSSATSGYGHQISGIVPEKIGAKRASQIFEQTEHLQTGGKSFQGSIVEATDLQVDGGLLTDQVDRIDTASSEVFNSIPTTGAVEGKKSAPKPLPKPKKDTGQVGGEKPAAAQKPTPKPLPKPKKNTGQVGGEKPAEAKKPTPKPLPKIHKVTQGLPNSGNVLKTGAKVNTSSSEHIAQKGISGAKLSSADSVKAMNEASERPQLTQSKTDDPGKKIYQKWTFNIPGLAEETIDRMDSVEKLQQCANKEISYLKEELSKCTDAAKQAKIEGRIAQLEKIVAKCGQGDVDWATSDYFRDILRGHSLLQSNNNPDGIKGAVREFAKLMDEEYYSRAPPVNMRYQICEVNGGTEYEGTTTGWARVGIISCMDNGFVNQESMRELQKSLNDGQHHKATYLRNTMTREIIDVWKKELANGNKNIDASAGYALTQLGFTLDQVEAMAGVVKGGGDFYDVPNDILQIPKDGVADVAKVVDEVTEKRNQLMANQFLQIVLEQLQHASPEDLANGELRMLHVGLLNHESRAVDGTGWYHNEDQEMQDMANIFDQFDQSKLICDGKGPYIDLDGNIHLPPMDQLPDGVKDLNLRAIYLNQSVQGHTKNDGTQKKLNERAMKKLQAMGLDDATREGFEDRMSDRKSGYTSAADTVNYALNGGFKVSTGCLSAKDRTGFVSALVSDRKMREGGLSEKFREKVMRRQITDHSPAVKVIRDNTGTKIMKITPFKIEGLTKGDFKLKSFFVRSTVYANQGIEILKERRRIAEYEKHGKPSDKVDGDTSFPHAAQAA